MTTKYECDRCGSIVGTFNATRYEIQCAARDADTDPLPGFDLCGECSDVVTEALEQVMGDE